MAIPSPEHLSDESKAFWREILDEFALDAHHLKTLQAACECWDRILEARAIISAEGSFFKDRFEQPKEHPAAKSERDNRIIFARLIRELGLDLDTPDPRPPRQY